MPYKYYMDINKDSCEFTWVYRVQHDGNKITIVNEMNLDEFILDKDGLINYAEITEAEYNKRIMECSK
jgi:hypothetical protein